MCDTFGKLSIDTLKTLDLNGNEEITNNILPILFDTIGNSLQSLRCLDVSKTNVNANIVCTLIYSFFRKYHNVTNIDCVACEDLLDITCGATEESIDKIKDLCNQGALPKNTLCDFYIFSDTNTNVVLEMSISKN